ncbi:MAG: M23 family metallopeptidase [Acidobacteria bacterium]|nr:M23 family metallopeptidase [Acidobacteriota bacterium]
MNDLVARAVIAVIAVGLGIARWRFHARLPVAAVAVVDWAMSIIAALGLTIVVVTALELFRPSLPLFSALAIYAVMYILVEAAIRSVQRQTSILVPGRDDEPDLEFPGLLAIAGPIGRFGPYGLTATFYSSQLLCFFNPFQLVETVRQETGNAALVGREKRSGDDGRGYRTRVTYTLPFDGEWFVASGGATPKTSHSWDILGQRFALDFVQVNDFFRTHTGRGTKAEEYFCYGREIRAAADGSVVAMEARVRQAFLGWGLCDFTARSFVGNHVLVKHAEGEFGLYAHLVRGSIAVAPGDRVERGQVLGLCGHTGHSTEPHLHFHLQDSADLFRGMGLPVRFSHLLVDGKAGTGVLLRAGNRARSQFRS